MTAPPPEITDAAEGAPPGAAPGESLREGRYLVVGSLGAGSQGETLSAIDKREGQAVAIKRFTIRGARSWKDVELAEREAAVLSSLSHPSLPRYIEHFEENGALYLVMEKVEGETLAARRKRGAVLSQEQVARFLHEASVCLAYLHGHAPPIVHRDIKPGNVILRPDGSYCLVDFGSVRDRLKPEGGSTVVGTFGYMAPEQFQGRAAPGSDVYAAAATALSLLTGSEPEDLPHRGLAIDVERALRGQVEPRLARALGWMLEPDPDRRAPSIAAALAKLGVATGASPRPPEKPPVAHDERARRAREESERRYGREARSDRRARKAEAKRERREERRAHRDPDAWHEVAHRYARLVSSRAHRSAHARARSPVPPGMVIGVVVLIALRIAGVATYSLFRVFLPLLLGLLAIFFGRKLFRNAQRMSEIGQNGEHGLRRAAQHIRHQLMGGPEPDPPAPRARAATQRPPPNAAPANAAPRVVIDAEEEAEELDLEHDDDSRRRR